VGPGGVNFCVFSKSAMRVDLLMLAAETDARRRE
jgi:hypothetical protein